MTITGRAGRGALVALLIAIGAMAPGQAFADPQVRTAPYDFGSRCVATYLVQGLQALPPPLEPYGYQAHTCQSDPVAQTTGLIGEAMEYVSPQPSIAAMARSSSSWVGVSFAVDEPGTVRVHVDSVAIRSAGVCVHIGTTIDPEGPSFGARTCESEFPGGETPIDHDATVPSAGQYWIFVRAHPDATISGFLPLAGAAVVTAITYELA